MTGKTVVVAGAGVVGLAIARAAARRAGTQVIVLEANKRVGMETSSRNSEVVHAGIYYRKDSLKAQLCVRGRDMLYEFCDAYDVPYQCCGKLIVAQTHQIEQLDAIARRGVDNGVTDLRMISEAEACRLEPEVECAQALFSPSTGIVDSHSLMLTMHGEAENHGAAFAFATKATSIRVDDKTGTVLVSAISEGSDEVDEVECDYFVNATGIFAPQLMANPTLETPTVSRLFAKGTYFKLQNNSRPFSHLVYPIPEVGGLGVHATLDLEGNIRFGPDVEWVSDIDYTPNPAKVSEFAERIRPYWRGVNEDNLVADYCGIRPKIEVNGKPFDDFFIKKEQTRGAKGVIHLCGIESPGLTSSLAIADYVSQLIED